MKVIIEMEISDWGRARVVEVIRRLGKVTAHLWRILAGNTLADVNVDIVLTRRAFVTPTAEAFAEWAARKKEWTVIPLPVWKKGR